MIKNVRTLGQVFTPEWAVEKMLALRQNTGAILEPSAGDGAFLRRLGKNAVGVEIDSRLAHQSGALCMDFFGYSAENQFDAIIGNPPYVRFRDIPPPTRAKLNLARFDRRSNLYLFFIEKSLRHLRDGGELIFITPRDFMKATSAAQLNRLLFESGTITHFEDLGDARIFGDFTPNCAIWRFEKNNFFRRTSDGKTFSLMNNQLAVVSGDYAIPFRDISFVKVGAVSGMDKVFADAQFGNRDFVYSQTAATGKTRRMICGDTPPPSLLAHKKELMARRIRRFDESNWWQWGRAHFESERPRIYVNVKTRRKNPFFIHSAKDYDGSVLAIFPKDSGADLIHLCEELNKVNWADLGFVCDGRFIFTQKSLEECILPKCFAEFAAAYSRERCSSFSFSEGGQFSSHLSFSMCRTAE